MHYFKKQKNSWHFSKAFEIAAILHEECKPIVPLGAIKESRTSNSMQSL